MEETNKYVLDKNELVNYMKYKYQLEFKKDITPIKLQKGLYFLFAFWGGWVRKGKNKTEMNDQFANVPENLFDSKFEAWAYGPVDQQVYSAFKNNKSYNEEKAKEFAENNGVAIDFVNDILKKVFNTGDFSLVDLSHRDKCWKNSYDRENPYDSNPIDAKDIINEYAGR